MRRLASMLPGHRSHVSDHVALRGTLGFLVSLPPFPAHASAASASVEQDAGFGGLFCMAWMCLCVRCRA